MATEKKTMTVAAAKAVAFVKEQAQFAGKWGTGEHLAAIRALVRDAASEAKVAPDGIKVLNEKLKAAFASDPEWGYASNMQKLLVAAGEIEKQAAAGKGYE